MEKQTSQYKCDKCGATFSDARMLEKHKQSHPAFAPPQSRENVPGQASTGQQRVAGTQQQKQPSKQTEQQPPQRAQTKQQQKATPQVKKEFRCDKCGAVFRDADALTKHEQVHMSSEKGDAGGQAQETTPQTTSPPPPPPDQRPPKPEPQPQPQPQPQPSRMNRDNS